MPRIVGPYLNGKRRSTIGELIDAQIEAYAACKDSRCGHVARIDLPWVAARMRTRQYLLTLLAMRLRCAKYGDDGDLFFPNMSDREI